MRKSNHLYIPFLFFCVILSAQDQDTLTVQMTNPGIIEEAREPYDPLAPSRAAFYSAVVPGLGQAYNEKYWKIPIIYAGIGTSIYFYIDRSKEHKRLRTAYKRRLAGYTDDEYFERGITTETLISAQRREQRNKDVSIAVAVGFYLLNIVDANVDAHLKQYNIGDDLSFQPNVNFNSFDSTTNYGISLTYRLK